MIPARTIEALFHQVENIFYHAQTFIYKGNTNIMKWLHVVK